METLPIVGNAANLANRVYVSVTINFVMSERLTEFSAVVSKQ